MELITDKKEVLLLIYVPLSAVSGNKNCDMVYFSKIPILVLFYDENRKYNIV